MIIGTYLVFSASGTYSEIRFNSFYFLFKMHLWKVIGAMAALIIVSMIPYEYYKLYSKHLLVGVILILLITFLFSPKIKGAARWIDLGVLQFQPSELAKLILIIHLANMMERKGKLISDFGNGFRYALVWIFIVSFLVLIQPNVSTSAILVLTSFILLYVGGCRLSHLAATSGIVGVAGFGVMMLFTHSRERIFSFIDSIKNVGEPNLQVMQAKIGLGSGGLLGLGIGHSRQSDLFLPESYGDFIFSILGEELGFVGTISILSIYFIIFFIGILIAKKAKDPFGQLLGFGISFNLVVSAFLNAAVVTGLMPTTGITLPMISFGGTSIIIFSVSIGILINIARQTIKEQTVEPIVI
jgi:cell division protein FtsW